MSEQIGDWKARAERAETACAAMRWALERMLKWIKASHRLNDGTVWNLDGSECPSLNGAINQAAQALASDAGRDFIEREKVKALVKALETCSTCATNLGYIGLPRRAIDEALALAKQLGLTKEDAK